MIKEYLKDLTQVEGIDGIAIFDMDNKIIDSWTAPNFEDKIFNEIGINYYQIFAILESSERDFHELVIQYEKGQVYTRTLPDIFILVITKTKTDIALIRLIINVAAPEFLNSRKLQKILKKSSKPSRNFLVKNYLDSTEQAYHKKIKST